MPNSTPIWKIAYQMRYPRQTVLFPGSRTYEVALFIQKHRLRSKYSWFVNVKPLVDKLGRKVVARCLTRLSTRYKMVIKKPTNKEFDRPFVWQVHDIDKCVLWTKETSYL